MSFTPFTPLGLKTFIGALRKQRNPLAPRTHPRRHREAATVPFRVASVSAELRIELSLEVGREGGPPGGGRLDMDMSCE